MGADWKPIARFFKVSTEVNYKNQIGRSVRGLGVGRNH